MKTIWVVLAPQLYGSRSVQWLRDIMIDTNLYSVTWQQISPCMRSCSALFSYNVNSSKSAPVLCTFPIVFPLKSSRFMLCSCSQIRWACIESAHRLVDSSSFIRIKYFFKHAGCRVCLLNNTNKCPRSMPSVLWRYWLGGRKGIRPVKNWVAVCWHGYLSGARCRLAYGPVDATATHCLLLQ